MASIRKRGRTNWEAQVRMRGWETQTRTFATKADAVHWASERETKMRRGTFVETSSLKAWTLRKILERYRLGVIMRLPMAGLTLDQVNTLV